MRKPWLLAVSSMVFVQFPLMADDSLVRFEGGNGIGTPAGQMVQARLFCGTAAFNSGLVALDPNGNFEIDDVLTPTPPATCATPILLIVNSGGRWFAAGIRKLH